MANPSSNKRVLVFRIWGLLLETFLFYPPLLLTSMLFTGSYSWADFGVSAVTLLIAGGFGFGAAQFLAWFERKHPREEIELDREVLQQMPKVRFDEITVMTISVYAVAAVILLVISVFFRGNILYGLLDGVLLMFCWVRIERSANKPYSSLYSLLEYVMAGVVYLLCTLCAFLLHMYFQLTYELAPMVLLFILLTVSAGILLNQANLDQTMERMKHNKFSLPKKIRLYNAMLIGGIMLLLVVAFIFRQQVFQFIVWICQMVFYGILGAFHVLISLLTSGSVPVPESEDPPPQPSIGDGVTGGDNAFLNYLLLAVVILLVVFVFTKFGRKWLKGIVRTLKNGLGKLLGWLNKAVPAAARPEGSAYYFDSVEELSSSTEESIPEETVDKRYFRRSLKSWRKLTDPAEKVRKGYGLLLRYAEQSREDISRADTVEEIKAKTAEERYGFALEQNSKAYEEVRYAERTPAPEAEQRLCQDVEQVLSKGGLRKS